MVSPDTTTRRHLGLQIGLAFIIIFLLVRFVGFCLESFTRHSPGFVAAYTASRVLLEGEEASQLYDDAWFAEQVSRFETGIYDIYVNPPTTALLMLPLAWLPYPLARGVWTAVNVITLFLLIYWLTRQLNLTGYWFWGVLILVLLYQPIYANIAFGQLYIFSFALLLAVWHGYRQGKEGLTGGALALLFLFKLAGLFLWLLLLVQKRWSALAWGGITIAAVILLTLPWLGTAAWQHHLTTLIQVGQRAERLVTAYQTWSGFAGHLFTFDAHWNPAPLVNQPTISTLLTGLGAIGLLVVSLVVTYRVTEYGIRNTEYGLRAVDLPFATFVILSVILSPLALDYHYPLLLLPIFILIAQTRQRGTLLSWLLLGVSFFLIAADLPYRSPRLAEGMLALLAYPKLYGALLLWGLTIFEAIQMNQKSDFSEKSDFSLYET
jgi:hypothetical protein